MAFVTFYWNKNFIYAIIYWIFEIFIRIFMYLNWSKFEMSNIDNQDEYIFMILLYIADLFSVFLYYYIKCTLKNRNNRENEQSDDSSQKYRQYLIYENREDNLSKDYLIKLIIICILNYFSRSLFWIAFTITGAEYEEIYHQLQNDIGNVVDILMRYILSIFMLRQVIYKHKKFSIVLIVIGFALLFPADIYCMYDNKEINRTKTLYYILILNISAFTFPIEETMIKQLFNKYYIIPERLMFHKALLGALILIIITPILYFSFGDKLSLVIDNGYKVLILIVYTFASFFKNYFLLKIIYHFSSQSVSFLIISESVAGSIDEIIDYIRDREDKEALDIISLIIEILGIILITIATLIYDEIIVIKRFGLDKNVKRLIEERAKNDKDLTKIAETVKGINIEDIYNQQENEDNELKYSDSGVEMN